MTKVAIVHHNLMKKGGGESVAMNVIEALQTKYDVTLLTLVNPNISTLNEYYSTNVDRESISIKILGVGFEYLYKHTNKFHIMKCAILSRLVKRHTDKFDLIVSTYNELSIDPPSLQYIHYPQFRRWTQIPNMGPIRKIYDQISKNIEGFEPAQISRNSLVANSQWTASVASETYHTDVDVIYPPINTEVFQKKPWGEREPGIVTIGRISEEKNLIKIIKVVKKLHDFNNDVHLHILGPNSDPKYYKKVLDKAKKFDFIHVEGEVEYETLIKRIEEHKYGIHGMKNEHFGMAVAEMAAGGVLPFVPDGGGQREIVKNNPYLIYDSVTDATNKIKRVMTDNVLREDLQDELSDTDTRFGKQIFKQQILSKSEEILTNGK